MGKQIFGGAVRRHLVKSPEVVRIPAATLAERRERRERKHRRRCAHQLRVQAAHKRGRHRHGIHRPADWRADAHITREDSRRFPFGRDDGDNLTQQLVDRGLRPERGAPWLIDAIEAERKAKARSRQQQPWFKAR